MSDLEIIETILKAIRIIKNADLLEDALRKAVTAIQGLDAIQTTCHRAVCILQPDLDTNKIIAQGQLIGACKSIVEKNTNLKCENTMLRHQLRNMGYYTQGK